MAKMIHVSNLDGSVDEAELKRLLAQCGEVRKVQVVRSPATRDSTGAALVEFSFERAAAAAIALLHGREYRGHTLTAHWATFRNESDAYHASMVGPSVSSSSRQN